MCTRARRPAPITLSNPCVPVFEESEEKFNSRIHASRPSKNALAFGGALDRLGSYGSSASDSDSSEPGSPPSLEYEFALNVTDMLRKYSRAVQEIVRHRQFGHFSLQVPAELMDHLYLGDASAAMDTEGLRAMGIDAIVNCASGAVLTNREYYDATFCYLEFEAEDHPDYELLDMHFEEMREFVDQCAFSGRKALVHCAAGINRSATLAVAYYLFSTKVGLLSAVEHCFRKRPIILCNESFINQLVMFAFRHNLLGELSL